MIDRHVILSVVYMVGAIALVLVAGIVYSSVAGKVIDNGLSTLGGTALGYLGGILTNVSRAGGGGGDSTPVTVTNTPGQAIPVEAQESLQRLERLAGDE